MFTNLITFHKNKAAIDDMINMLRDFTDRLHSGVEGVPSASECAVMADIHDSSRQFILAHGGRMEVETPRVI